MVRFVHQDHSKEEVIFPPTIDFIGKITKLRYKI